MERERDRERYGEREIEDKEIAREGGEEERERREGRQNRVEGGKEERIEREVERKD